ncbi:hypothetical protein HID58_005763 [Brassica napus]|uniref:Neprosin PEP catalytic domain-containing protein n=1 Tax=Brassica napus TaxID=3708 RepID=A0ABQ8EA75_BRANA|nr:hypothetical protein HID58_005763 [Brassica napus]
MVFSRFLRLILLLSLVSSSFSYTTSPSNSTASDQTLRPQEEIQKLKLIRNELLKINKPAVKTIQSSDGDTIDCVPTHQQPAFDHPLLHGQRPMDLVGQLSCSRVRRQAEANYPFCHQMRYWVLGLVPSPGKALPGEVDRCLTGPRGMTHDPPEMPKGYSKDDESYEDSQLWSLTGESCPEGTVPIRRTTEQDMLRASSVRRFGRKIRRVRRDSTSNGHEHAVGYVSGRQYYGAKASINVWSPIVTSQYEFSLSQIWVIAGSFTHDLNTIEAGWQISPELYGDTYPRFFTYWTSDAYRTTGCYNLLCSGFVQTNRRIAIGAAISPRSSYKGGQFDIRLLIWKDPKHGHWWLQFGSGVLVGYWPAFLFTHLRQHGSMVQFGGEIVNTRPGGSHTSTQMGSGHFAGEGFGKASYFRNLQMVDWDNTLIPVSNLKILADHPNCYDIRGGTSRVWGNYFYYGGPGKNPRCP